MAEATSEIATKSLIGQLSIRTFCDPTNVSDLTPEQQAALHRFRHKILASGYSLYEKVPRDKADRVVKGILKDILDAIP
jgi:hypothetical protein